MEAKRSAVRRTAAQWSEIIRSWKASGESAEQYALNHGLNAGTLRWWRRQLLKRNGRGADRKEAQHRPGSKASSSGFTEVAVKPAAVSGSALEVVSPSGHRVVVRGSVDACSLQTVLEVLERC